VADYSIFMLCGFPGIYGCRFSTRLAFNLCLPDTVCQTPTDWD